MRNDCIELECDRNGFKNKTQMNFCWIRMKLDKLLHLLKYETATNNEKLCERRKIIMESLRGLKVITSFYVFILIRHKSYMKAREKEREKDIEKQKIGKEYNKKCARWNFKNWTSK